MESEPALCPFQNFEASKRKDNNLFRRYAFNDIEKIKDGSGKYRSPYF